MVATTSTVGMCARVLARHLPREKALDILRDLAEVPGNMSFVETTRMLLQCVETDKSIGWPRGDDR